MISLYIDWRSWISIINIGWVWVITLVCGVLRRIQWLVIFAVEGIVCHCFELWSGPRVPTNHVARRGHAKMDEDPADAPDEIAQVLA